MKKLLFSLSLLASLATFAGESTVDATAQVFGTLGVSSTASNVIVSVPWVTASNTNANQISVADIVKTAGLTAGDWIRVWDDASDHFRVWTLTKEGDNPLYWKPTTTVTTNGVEEGATSADTFLHRGDALVLYRQFPTNFYVYGQYKALSSSDKTYVTKGDSKTAAYTLIAPPMTPSANTIDLNNDMTWDGEISAKDRLIYGESASMGTVYQYVKSNEQWGYYEFQSGKTTFVPAPAIKAGVGFWYMSKGGNPTITWTK